MIGVGAFVDFEWGVEVVVVRSNLGSEFSFFFSAIANLMRITHPATLGFIFKIGVQMFVSISLSYYYSTL